MTDPAPLTDGEQRLLMAWLTDGRRGDPPFAFTERQLVSLFYGRRPRRDPEVRFWEKVDKNGPTPGHAPQLGPCWLWTASTSKGGYGQFEGTSAHRFSFRAAHGSIPDGRHVLHHCDNPPCVNPAHLYAGDNFDNARDKLERGRLGRRPAPPHLSRGSIREMRPGYWEYRWREHGVQRYAYRRSIEAIVRLRAEVQSESALCRCTINLPETDLGQAGAVRGQLVQSGA